MMISLIVAVDNFNAIGKDVQLCWKLPDDLKMFKSLTENNTVVMGRKTYESIGRPLPNRKNIIFSTQKLIIPGCTVISDPLTLKQHVEGNCFIIGGAKLYEMFLPEASEIHFTRVDCAIQNPDVYFPTFGMQDNVSLIEKKTFNKDHKNEFDFTYYKFKRM